MTVGRLHSSHDCRPCATKRAYHPSCQLGRVRIVVPVVSLKHQTHARARDNRKQIKCASLMRSSVDTVQRQQADELVWTLNENQSRIVQLAHFEPLVNVGLIQTRARVHALQRLGKGVCLCVLSHALDWAGRRQRRRRDARLAIHSSVMLKIETRSLDGLRRG